MAKSNEPIVWSLFSAGGVITAFLVPALILILGLAVPLGCVKLNYDYLARLLHYPLARLVLFVLVFLPLFHWAHRFRFTLVDLGLKKLAGPIAFLCYGSAIAGTVVAAVVLWQM